MTNQLQGEVLFGGWSGSTASDWAYTPWMPVRGDVGTFAVQVLQRNNVTLTWNVETRTSESSTVVSLFATNLTIAAVDTLDATNSGASDEPAKEWVRYKFATGGSASVTDFAMFRALQPSWRANR